MGPKFKIGDRVRRASDPDSVGVIFAGPQSRRGSFYYQVFFSADKRDMSFPESALVAHDEPDNFTTAFERGEFLEKSTFLQFLILEKIRKPLSDNLYTFYASRTDFQVHQFKPVLKFISSVNQRLFLADEVGLGKTIEAGIILAELQARHQGLRRVLVVCPAALLGKWEVELRRRFGESFDVLRRAEFSAFLDRYERYGDNERLKAIVSLQTLRSATMLTRLEELQVNFDLVMIDESHHMKNPATHSSALGEVLSDHADALVMISATPLHLGSEDLFNQLHILSSSEFPDFSFFTDLIEPNQHLNAALRTLQRPQEAAQFLRLVEGTTQRQRFLDNPNYGESLSALESSDRLNTAEAIRIQRQLTELNTLSHIFVRTRRRDVSTDVHFPQRQAVVLDVNFTTAERELYDAVTNWVISRYQDSASGLSFAKIMPQRQVSSCIPAMRGYLTHLLREEKIRAPREDDGDHISESDDADDDLLDNSELVAIRQLLKAAERVGDQDTKFEKFIAALRDALAQNPNAKVVVFSFFKRTLEYLQRQLSRAGVSNVMIHGDVPARDRERRVRTFWDDPSLTVLLSSEVGGEGLDLQIGNVLFNYDLPWNPMRIEQRIGRLDRYGQKNDKILVYNFSMKGTIDDIILDRLYGRINLFERYIGDLEAILGGRINELVREMFDPGLTDIEREARADKIGENLLREQQELERFGREGERFLGQDEFFTREISRIHDTRRFVTADEIRFLLEAFLERKPGSTLTPPRSGRQNVFVLKSGHEFRGLIHQYAPDDDGKKEILRKLDEQQGVLLTFDSAEACRDDSLVFVTIHSPLIKAIARFTEQDPAHTSLPLGRLKIRSYSGLLGTYFFFVYLLEKEGAKKSLRLVPILVSASDSNNFYFYDDDEAELILGKLVDGEDLVDDIGGFSAQDVKAAESVADDCITLIREDEEASLRRSNEILLNNQIASIRQARGIKANRIRQTIQELNQRENADPRILRLHEGRLRKLRQRAEDDIRKWEAKREVSVGYRRIAGGLIHFA